MLRRLSVLLALFAVVAPASAANASPPIWTQLASGTTGTISAIVYQSPTRLWYATTSGTIAYLTGSGFSNATGIPFGEDFVDLAFQPTSVAGAPGTIGLYGYAVTANGHVWESSNGGASWTQLSSPMTRADCSSSTAVAEAELNAVVFANSTTVFLLGNNSTILRSTAADTSSPAFTEMNKNGSGTCQIQGAMSTVNMTDATFLPSNPDDGLFVDQSFGALFDSSNALSGAPTGARLNDDTVNSFSGNPRIAQDPNNPNDVWIVDHESGGDGCGALCLTVSSDGGSTSTAAKFANDTNPVGGLYGITSQGGVEVTAGSGGEIFTSLDGSNFYNQPAGGALAGENWRAVAAFDAQHAAVGGTNGALAVTAAANTLPDTTAPTGSISGPVTVTSGQAVTYTGEVADNAGGSGIDASSLTWTAPGYPTQHGTSASFTFPPGAGHVTLTLTFADNAGNSATATIGVTVSDAAAAATTTTTTAPPPPPSGSGPLTTLMSGTTIKVFKTVTVTGRSARYVPVIVAATKPRRFSVRILPVKGGGKVLASAHTTIRAKHGGHRTIRVQLPARVGPGRYLIVIRVSTLGGKTVGRVLRFKFRLN